jgi:hypothetical protein
MLHYILATIQHAINCSYQTSDLPLVFSVARKANITTIIDILKKLSALVDGIFVGRCEMSRRNPLQVTSERVLLSHDNIPTALRLMYLFHMSALVPLVLSVRLFLLRLV